MDSTKKNIDILSFDGGGSRGIMELSILNDVMRLATIVLRRPETLDYLVKDDKDENKENVLEDPEVRQRLIDDLKAVTNPIHPIDVYQMIVGTSTSGLIAFGLVGGKKGEDGKRIPMSVEECIEMYLDNIMVIFRKSWTQWIFSHIPGLSSIPLSTYSQDNVRTVLLKQFGDSCLEDFRGTTGSDCVAGAVAMKLGEERELVLFDTRSEDYQSYKVYEVLLASSNAPVYFETPVKIGKNKFVDGGVGGNCPLAQAIPRAKELFGNKDNDAEISSVLSLAPPHSSVGEIYNIFQIKYWLDYFVYESTDGLAGFNDVVKWNRRKKTLFQRLAPRGERLKKFKLDDVDCQKMLDAMEREKEENDMYLIDVIASAMQVVFTSIEKVPDRNDSTLMVAAELAQTAARAYQSSKEYSSAIFSYKTSIRLLKLINSKSVTISKIYLEIAKCLKAQGKYQSAINANMKVLAFKALENATLLDTSINLADCYTSTFRFEDAETCLQEFLDSHHSKDERFYVRALTSMAWCKEEQGKLDEAVKQYKQASTYINDNTGRDNVERAEILNNIGLCYLDLKMNDEALIYLQESQQMRNRLCNNENDHLLAESYNNVGLCWTEIGDYEQAHENLTKALEMVTKTENDLWSSFVLQNLAYCLSLSNKDHDLALTYAQQALEKMTRHVADFNNNGIAKILAIRGLCLLRSGRFEEARKNLEESSTMIERSSETHPWLLDNYKKLSALYKETNQPDKAQEYEKKANRIENKIKEMAKNISEN